MSDPQFERPIQPEPFSGRPEATARGCSRPVLVGCGVVVVLLALLLLGFFWKAKDLFRWSLEQFEAQIAQTLPEDLDQTDRQRLAAAFDAAAEAVEEDRADPAALQRLQGLLLAALGAERLSREEVLELIEVLEAVAGLEPDQSPAPERADPAPVPVTQSVEVAARPSPHPA